MYAYSLESIRFFPKNSGALFWMYNDTWGEVGWTIIDYYLDRKPSFYYVKRAFAPVKFILRPSGDKKTVKVMGVNDTPDSKTIELEYGYVSFSGKYDTARTELKLPPFTKGIVHEFAMPPQDLKQGLVFVRAGNVPLALLRTGPFRDYAARESSVTVLQTEKTQEGLKVTLESSGYSHAVSLGLPPEIHLDDDYFDMLPGEKRVVTVKDAALKLDKASIKPVWLAPGTAGQIG
jgi:beta-mannosidase